MISFHTYQCDIAETYVTETAGIWGNLVTGTLHSFQVSEMFYFVIVWFNLDNAWFISSTVFMSHAICVTHLNSGVSAVR